MEKRIGEIRKGLLRWYDFKTGSRILYIGNRNEAIAQLLASLDAEVFCAELQDTLKEDFAVCNRGVFDYLVSVAELEKSMEPDRALAAWKALLKADGHMLLGMNNRLGVRYFCGDRDAYTGRSMDSIEDYRRAYANEADPFRGKTYDKDTLQNMLKNAGIKYFQFFSVLSDLSNPSFLYAEDYLPKEDLSSRVFPTYNHPDTVFLEEAPLYDGLMRNGMFHQMANAYLIECSMDGVLSDVCHVTNTSDRGAEDALVTVIYKSGMVEKRAVYPEGIRRLEELEAHGRELSARGIQVVEGKVRNGVYRMPYVEAEAGQLYLKRLLFRDKAEFLAAMDHFRDLILSSSEIEEPDKGDGKGAILRKGYLDMVPLNSFLINGEFVFFDQEFSREHYPANVLLLRMVSSFYLGNKEGEKILPREELFDRYGLTKELARWYRMEGEFLGELLQKKELRIYYEKCRADLNVINANRQRMNYSQTEYERLFEDIFKGTAARKLILFGSGSFAKRFLSLYRNVYAIWAVIDNNETKWGQQIEGVTIRPPEILKQLKADEYKVLVCVKNYLAIMKQLDDMGIRSYSIFDPSKSYPRSGEGKVPQTDKGAESALKKYHIGYVAGVFDMFHVGHLNLLRRAKEQCDYLIVGIVSDEGVYRKKKKHTVIPCMDRMEVVGSCRYVDQVEELPVGYDSVRDAYKLFRFDCLFTGTDYAEHPDWIADREFLERQGAELMFFPYTEKVSSTMLREKLKTERQGEAEGRED